MKARSIGRLRYALYPNGAWRASIRLYRTAGFINLPKLTFAYRIYPSRKAAKR